MYYLLVWPPTASEGHPMVETWMNKSQEVQDIEKGADSYFVYCEISAH